MSDKCQKCAAPIDADGYCENAECGESCAVTATCPQAATDWPKVTRSRVREDLDESNNTAIQCEACGFWATEREPVYLGPDDGAMYLCRSCYHGKSVPKSMLLEMLSDAARNGVWEGAAYATKLHGVTNDAAVSAYATNVFNALDVSEIVGRVLSKVGK